MIRVFSPSVLILPPKEAGEVVERPPLSKKRGSFSKTRLVAFANERWVWALGLLIHGIRFLFISFFASLSSYPWLTHLIRKDRK